MAEPPITLALSKGRILEESMPLLRAAGIEPDADPESSRRLVLGTRDTGVRLVVVRASDVPAYVQFGAADLGIIGKDVLAEHGGAGMYELLDLGIARCRLVVAARAEDARDGPRQRIRVATKYVRLARRHFAAVGVQADIIHLYGSMELAPLVGLAQRIVDLTDTGSTLRANGLVELETIMPVSSRLVANRASMKLRHRDVQDLAGRLAAAVAGSGTPATATGGA